MSTLTATAARQEPADLGWRLSSRPPTALTGHTGSVWWGAWATLAGGPVLATTDARSRRRFAAYWVVVGPLSALIRRLVLRRLAIHVEHQ